MKSHYAMRRDDNEPDIVKALEGAGAVVQKVTQGKGVPDLLVGFRGKLTLIEVKDGNKVPSKQKLTKDQVEFFEKWKDLPCYVANCEKQALEMIGAIKDDIKPAEVFAIMDGKGIIKE